MRVVKDVMPCVAEAAKEVMPRITGVVKKFMPRVIGAVKKVMPRVTEAAIKRLPVSYVMLSLHTRIQTPSINLYVFITRFNGSLRIVRLRALLTHLSGRCRPIRVIRFSATEPVFGCSFSLPAQNFNRKVRFRNRETKTATEITQTKFRN